MVVGKLGESPIEGPVWASASPPSALGVRTFSSLLPDIWAEALADTLSGEPGPPPSGWASPVSEGSTCAAESHCPAACVIQQSSH